MKLLVLSPYPERLTPFLKDDSVSCTTEKITPEYVKAFDFGISYGYRHILKAEHLEALPCINLHISYLPWNRGADPNLWSWIDNTPKGVSIHWIDQGIDTGDIIAQRMTIFDPKGHHTLASTYEALHASIVQLFSEIWPRIRNGSAPRAPQLSDAGSSHRVSAKQMIHFSYDMLVSGLSGSRVTGQCSPVR